MRLINLFIVAPGENFSGVSLKKLKTCFGAGWALVNSSHQQGRKFPDEHDIKI